MFMDITGINFLDQKVDMACAKASLRCTQISVVFIYLIKMWIWHVLRLDTDVHGYYCY